MKKMASLREQRKRRVLCILNNYGEETRASFSNSLKLREPTIQGYIKELLEENKLNNHLLNAGGLARDTGD